MEAKGEPLSSLVPGASANPQADGSFNQELLEETLLTIITPIAQEIEQDMAKASTCKRSQMESPSRMPPRLVYQGRRPTAVPAPWAGVSGTPLIPRPVPVYRGSHPPPALQEVMRPASPTSTRGQSSRLTFGSVLREGHRAHDP